MKLYEYMAKEVLRNHGIPTPPGRLARTAAEAVEAAREIGPVAVKAQVLVGGRGKAGGIKLADTPEDAGKVADEILGMNLKGYIVESVYVEGKLEIDRELYLGIAVDTVAKTPLVIASAAGGVNIEEVPEKDIVRLNVPIEWGFFPFMGRDIARRLGLEGTHAKQFVDIVQKLYTIFREYDAELVEINPLAIVGDRVIAADARLNLDDDAMFRHPDVPVTSEATDLEKRVRELGLAFVQLDGDIAVMANGAGITMATLDVLKKYGGEPMNFLDAGGGADAGPTAKALEILVATNPKAVFINIFGGITRCDEVAKAIIQAKNSVGIPMPLVVRLVGTNQEQGVAMLAAEGIQAFSSMDEAAERVVQLANGGAA